MHVDAATEEREQAQRDFDVSVANLNRIRDGIAAMKAAKIRLRAEICEAGTAMFNAKTTKDKLEIAITALPVIADKMAAMAIRNRELSEEAHANYAAAEALYARTKHLKLENPDARGAALEETSRETRRENELLMIVLDEFEAAILRVTNQARRERGEPVLKQWVTP